MSKKSYEYMILINMNISDNFTMMRGIIRFFLIICIACICNCYGAEKIGIITDTLLTPVNYYNAYFRTPEFFANDIRHELSKKGITVVPLDTTENALKKAGLRQYDLEGLQGLEQGYNLDYRLLKKIAQNIGVKKLVVVTMGMDIQRDFLKNTVWNMMNVSGQDVVNPTHRISVYAAFVDVNNENVLWESIYAKNIRNNKMKNLDTTISNNYEGMLRLKEYSKYISPDVAYNVKMKMLNPNFVEPPTHITRENIVQYAKDKHNIGVKKELSEIDRQKWDYEKLAVDTKTNVVTVSKAVGNGVKRGAKATTRGIRKGTNATANGVRKVTNKTYSTLSRFFSKFKRKTNTDWL